LTRIYIAPFHAAVELGENGWPYDNGDDPSFRAAREKRGPLTWGVCRQDVRNALRAGDVVAFFSFRKQSHTGASAYRFCCVATVEQKISQADVWKKKGFGIFRRYCNILVRPSESRGYWEHFEPCLQGNRRHKDWLWRTALHVRLKKERFEDIHKSDHFKPGAMIGGIRVDFAPNYVIFSSDPTKTLVLPDPPVVATHYKGKAHEEWREDRISQGIMRLTLGEAARVSKARWLRTGNLQRPHRQIRFELTPEDTENWRASLMRLVT